MRNTRIALSMAMGLLGACSAGPNRLDGSLQASDGAHAQGIDAYVVLADRVEVYGVDHELRGVVTVSAPKADERLVRIEHGSDAPYEVEVTRPMQDGSFKAPIADDANGQVLADPALKVFFEGYRLAFQVTALEALAPSDALAPETTFVACSDITFASGCFSFTSCYNSTGSGTLPGGSTFFSFSGDNNACQTQCDTSFGTGNRYGVKEGSDCKCYSSYTSGLDRYAACPRANCPSGYLDKVSKHRQCLNPGSCSSSAQGWVGNPDGCILDPLMYARWDTTNDSNADEFGWVNSGTYATNWWWHGVWFLGGFATTDWTFTQTGCDMFDASQGSWSCETSGNQVHLTATNTTNGIVKDYYFIP